MKPQKPMPNESHLQEGEAASEGRLRAALHDAYPAMQPSPQLRARVAEMAAAHALRTTRQRTVRLRLRAGLGLAGAAAMLALMVMMWPRVVLAQMLRRMDAAMNGAQSAHIISWKIKEGGSRVKERETWHQNGRLRLETWPSQETGQSRRIEVFTDGRLWRYEPQFDKVTVRRQDGPFGSQPGGFTGAACIRRFTSSNWRNKVSVRSENVQVGGRAARRVHIQTSGAMEDYNIVLLVEAATDLPIEMEMEVTSVHSGKKLKLFAEFQFDQVLAASLFEPKFPAGTRVVDHDKGKEEWRQRLAKGIARQKVGDRTIVIRDLQVNAEGDVFLLYTAGKRPGDSFRGGQAYAGRDWEISLMDEFGTEYKWSNPTMGFQPMSGNGKADPNSPNGYVFNGERLEGDWWIPSVPQKPWKPRRFTITFQVNPTNLHGDWDGPVLKTNLSETARFTLPVQRPATALVPDYMPYMFMGLWREEDVRKAEADVRGLLPPGVEESPQIIHTLLSGKDSVDALAFSPDGKTLASAWDSGIQLWNTRTGKLSKTLTTQATSVTPLAFSSDGQTLAGASHLYEGKKRINSLLQLWDTKSGEAELKIKLPDETTWLGALDLSPDGRTLTSTGLIVTEAEWKDGERYVAKAAAQVRSWSAHNGKALQTRTIPHDGFILGFAPLPGGSAIVTSLQRSEKGINQGSLIRLWDVETGKAQLTFEAPDRFEARLIAVSPDGKVVAGGGNAYTGDTTTNTNIGTRVHLWDARTGKLLQTMRGDDSHDWVSGLAFSLDGNKIAVVQGKMVYVWDAQSGKQLHSFVGHGKDVMKVSFSPDGKILASGDLVGVIKLWRIE